MKVSPALKQHSTQHHVGGTTSPNSNTSFVYQKTKITGLIYQQNQTPSNRSKGSLHSTELLPGTFSTEQRQQHELINNLSNSKPFKRLMDEKRGSITDKKKINLPQKNISEFKQNFFLGKKHSMTQDQNRDNNKDFNEAVISNESFGKQNKKVDTAVGSNQDDLFSKKVLNSNQNLSQTVNQSEGSKSNQAVVNQILIKHFLTSPKKAFYNVKDLYENYNKSCKLQEVAKLNQNHQIQRNNMRDFSFQVTDQPDQQQFFQNNLEEGKRNETAKTSHQTTRLQLYDNQREIYSAYPQKHRSHYDRKNYTNAMRQRNSASLVFSIQTTNTNKSYKRRRIDKFIMSESSKRDVYNYPSAETRSYMMSPDSSRSRAAAQDYLSQTNHNVQFNMIDSSKTQKFKKIIIESSDVKDTSIMTDFNYSAAFYDSSSRMKKGTAKSQSREARNQHRRQFSMDQQRISASPSTMVTQTPIHQNQNQKGAVKTQSQIQQFRLKLQKLKQSESLSSQGALASKVLNKRRSSQFSLGNGKDSIQTLIQKTQIFPQTPCLENEALASALMKQNQKERNGNLKYNSSRNNQSQLGIFPQNSKISPSNSIKSNHFLAFSSKQSPFVHHNSPPLKLYHQHSDHPPQPSSRKFNNQSQDLSLSNSNQTQNNNNNRQRINLQFQNHRESRVVSNMQVHPQKYQQYQQLQNTDESIFLKESSRFNLGKQISVKCNIVNDFKVFQLDTTSDQSSRKQRQQLQHVKPQNTVISSPQQIHEQHQIKMTQLMKRIQQSNNLINIQKSVLTDESKLKYQSNNLTNIITSSQFSQLFASYNRAGVNISPGKIMVNDQFLGKNPFKIDYNNNRIMNLVSYKRHGFANNEVMSAQIVSNSPDLLSDDLINASGSGVVDQSPVCQSRTLLNRIVESNQSDNDKNLEQDEDEYPEETLEMNPNIRRSRYF